MSFTRGNGDSELVTCVLLCYNQVEYVLEAVESLLSQDYSPLEVILSDDASTDGSADVIRAAAARYSGPHKVIVNINRTNLGLIAHINRVMRLATGRLVVPNAGDDVSLPNRARAVHSAWTAAGQGAQVVYSQCFAVDRTGASLGVRLPRSHARFDDRRHMALYGGWIVGATGAWTRDLFERFGPLMQGLMVEDHALPFRAAMLDGVVFVDEPLVRYREGVSCWWRGTTDPSAGVSARCQRYQHHCRIQLSNAAQAMADLEVLGDRELRELGQIRLSRAEAMMALSKSSPRSARGAWRAWQAGVGARNLVAWQLQTHVPYGVQLVNAIGMLARLVSR